MSATKKFLVELQKAIGGHPQGLHDAIGNLLKEVEPDEKPKEPAEEQLQQPKKPNS
jgi:predicted metal-dependent TIM-barrel fold hydrolase